MSVTFPLDDFGRVGPCSYSQVSYLLNCRDSARQEVSGYHPGRVTISFFAVGHSMWAKHGAALLAACLSFVRVSSLFRNNNSYCLNVILPLYLDDIFMMSTKAIRSLGFDALSWLNRGYLEVAAA